MSRLWWTLLLVALGCGYDSSDRWLSGVAAPPVCSVGARRCTAALEICQAGPSGPSWQIERDCAAAGLTCVPTLLECRRCAPTTARCDGQTVLECSEDGWQETASMTCPVEQERVCREGRCVDLCSVAAARRSNVGCEYWAVDLDNAMVDHTLNAAAQQFAVVISNPQPDLPARITIEQDDSEPGTSHELVAIQGIELPPLSLHAFKLGPREVDGSRPGTFDTGTHTALTRAAYRIKSSLPVVAYQFNPLDNVNVFSNDASLLKPVEALGGGAAAFGPKYVVLGWPQTIAATDDPGTNFNPAEPTALRSFLTLVGTRENTRVRVHTAARILGGGPVPETAAGAELDFELQPFEVLNLETNDFNADFTGSVVHSDQPVVVFSGSEASDAPRFDTLAARSCCADHLEEQLDPIRTAGKRFVATVSSNRSAAVAAAGSELGVVAQPEYFRIIAATSDGARVRTTLPAPQDTLELRGQGDWVELSSTAHFVVESDAPVMLASISPSQDAAGVPSGLPGGDPSFLIVPPVEQFRASYVFLTPDKYSFDFIRVIAPPDATIRLDGMPLESWPGCSRLPGDGLTASQRGSTTPPFYVHVCQLSFPEIDPNAPTAEGKLRPGRQNDGVHRLESDYAVGLLVDGFDAFVSYAYAGGTELETLVIE